MSSASLPVTICLILMGLGLSFAPETVAARWRTITSEFIRPGQQAVRATAETVRDITTSIQANSTQATQKELTRLKAELENSNARIAGLTAQLTVLRDEQLRDNFVPSVLRRLPRLASPSLIDAAVLGELFTQDWRSGRILDHGSASGVREASLVLNSRQPLVDIGEDGELAPEDPLLFGRSVIGKIERVGRWTSTFLLVTDTEFRGRAQLIHESNQGFAFGASGILKGTGGKHCRLEGIASTEAVQVGDDVYSVDREGISNTPLYFGRVVEATLGVNDDDWKVLVEPTPLPQPLTAVQVLRTTVNQQRLTVRAIDGDRPSDTSSIAEATQSDPHSR